MATHTAVPPRGRFDPHRLRATHPHRHLLIPRAAAGVPLLGIGLVHVFDPASSMRPLVEAAGFALPAVVSPIAVAIEIAAGLALLVGLWARPAAALAIPTMLGAIYAHLVIGVWPNGADKEPPLLLPVVVLVSSAYVLWRGAGRWSVDARSGVLVRD